MYNYGDRVWFATSTVGTGTLSVGVALAGYSHPAQAGFATGDDVNYTLVDGINWEVGSGTFTIAAPWTLSRDIVSQSSAAADARISLSGNAACFITASSAVINAVAGIASVAALRASKAMMANVVQVMGFATPGDGGEGSFILVESDTTSANNGGTIIVDASGRRWYRTGTNGQTYNVKWFGAKGDGITDDLAAINATIVAAVAKGGIVFFPPGVYAISNTIQIRHPDITLQGSGAGNWLFGFQPNKGTTLLFTGAAITDAIIDIAPGGDAGGTPGTSSSFVWGVNVRDFTLDCNGGLAGIGLLGASICNGEFSNLNIFQPGSVALYLCAAVTPPNIGFTMRCNFRNINISTGPNAHGLICDGQPGGHDNIGGVSLCYFENIGITHGNGNAYDLRNTDSLHFVHCGASRSPDSYGYGLIFGSSSDGSGRVSQNNRFFAFICAGTPVGSAAPIWSQGGLVPAVNNYVELSQMDGDPYIRVDYASLLYYETIGSYIPGSLPKMLKPGIYTEDASSGSISPAVTRLRVRGNDSGENVLIDVLGGQAVGGGAKATLPMWYTPMNLMNVAFSDLPAMGVGNGGCMVFCYNGRRPSEGAGGGTGVPVYWGGSGQWISMLSGLPVTA